MKKFKYPLVSDSWDKLEINSIKKVISQKFIPIKCKKFEKKICYG